MRFSFRCWNISPGEAFFPPTRPTSWLADLVKPSDVLHLRRPLRSQLASTAVDLSKQLAALVGNVAGPRIECEQLRLNRPLELPDILLRRRPEAFLAGVRAEVERGPRILLSWCRSARIDQNAAYRVLFFGHDGSPRRSPDRCTSPRSLGARRFRPWPALILRSWWLAAIRLLDSMRRGSGQK